MNKFNLLILFLALSTLFRCNRVKPFNIDKENYSIKFSKVNNSNNYSNSIQTKPLNIDAEMISLKNLLALVIKTDTSAIKFEDKIIGNKMYSVKIVQKNDAVQINDLVVEDISKKLNLKVETQQFKSFEIIIKDSLKFLKHLSKTNNNVSKIINSKDSISIKNLELIKFTELLNKEYPNTITCKKNYKKIDYKWRRSTLKNLKQNIQKDLGLILSDTKSDKFIYTFKKN